MGQVFKKLSDRQRWSSLLEACGGALGECKRVHEEIVKHGLEEDASIAKQLLRMYLNCRSVTEARQVFDKLADRNVVLWTSMITAYAQNGQHLQGLILFRRMQLDGEGPNRITFIATLGTCSALEDGRRLHSLISENGLASEVNVGTSLISMYSRCGSWSHAVEQFERMPERNLVTWSVMIAACNHHHQAVAGVKFFRRMQLHGVKPDKVTFVSLLDVCSSCSYSLREASVPDDMLATFGTEVETNVILGTALLNMYANCGMLEEVDQVFTRMTVKNVVSWTALVTAYCQHGLGQQAMESFHRMQLEGIRPNVVAFVNVLNACSANLPTGSRIHELVTECGAETGMVLGNAIVNMYGKCGRTDRAREFFNKLVKVNTENLVLWNGMFAAYAMNGYFEESLQLFAEMQLEGVRPNKATYASILLHSRRSVTASARYMKLLGMCVEESGLKEEIGGLATAAESVDLTVIRDVIWWSSLIAESEEQGLYSKCREYFGRMQLEGVTPNETTLASVLYVHDLVRGRLLHQLILDSGVCIDIGIGTALMNLYSRSGLPERACDVFLYMQSHNVVSWTAMIHCYAYNRRNSQALQLYRKMHLEGLRADSKTYTAILSLGLDLPLHELDNIRSCIRESGYHVNNFVSNTLLSIYGKTGTLEEACELFRHSDPLRVSSWSCMIATASRHGSSGYALVVFARMQQEGVRADDITLLCLLAACSHAGLAEHGLRYFVSMVHDYGVKPRWEHSSCMADMLGRAGRLEDAEELIRRIPSEDRGASTWMTLLGACRTQGDLQRAKEVSSHVRHLNPEHAQNYLVLSNAYAEGA